MGFDEVVVRGWFTSIIGILCLYDTGWEGVAGLGGVTAVRAKIFTGAAPGPGTLCLRRDSFSDHNRLHSATRSAVTISGPGRLLATNSLLLTSGNGGGVYMVIPRVRRGYITSPSFLIVHLRSGSAVLPRFIT